MPSTGIAVAQVMHKAAAVEAEVVAQRKLREQGRAVLFEEVFVDFVELGDFHCTVSLQEHAHQHLTGYSFIVDKVSLYLLCRESVSNVLSHVENPGINLGFAAFRNQIML